MIPTKHHQTRVHNLHRFPIILVLKTARFHLVGGVPTPPDFIWLVVYLAL